MTSTTEHRSNHSPDDDPIPPLTSADSAPPVRTDEDVRRRWRSLMGDGGFGRTSLWIVWYDADGYQLPVVVPVDDLPEVLDDAAVDNLIMVVGQPAAMGASSVALALSRPGTSSVTETDRHRVNAILAAVARARERGTFHLALWPMHLATANSVRRLTVDDLV